MAYADMGQVKGLINEGAMVGNAGRALSPLETLSNAVGVLREAHKRLCDLQDRLVGSMPEPDERDGVSLAINVGGMLGQVRDEAHVVGRIAEDIHRRIAMIERGLP